MRKPKASESIAAILLGDDLAKLVAQLGSEPGEKLILITIGIDGVRVAVTPGTSRAEALGSLTLAADAISYGGGFIWK